MADVQRSSDRMAALSGETPNRLRSMRNVINRLLGTISNAQVLNGNLFFNLVLEDLISQPQVTDRLTFLYQLMQASHFWSAL